MMVPEERRVVREEVVETPSPAVGPVPPVAAVPVEPVSPVVAEPVPAYNYRAVQAVWFVVGLVDALIAIRFAMKLLGASPAAAFTAFIYGLTEPLVAPFRGIFGATAQSGYVFEPASLVAILVYALLGWGIVALIRISTAPRGTRPVR